MKELRGGSNGASGPSTPTVLSRSNYNIKDQLTQKNLAQVNGQFLQNIDYGYNVRGWLTNINSVAVNSGAVSIMTPNMLGTGVIQNLAIAPFIAQALNNGMNEVRNTTAAPPKPVLDNADLFSENIYYNNAATQFQANAQYNGNIQATAWQVAGRTAQGYGYTYDELDRMTEAKYFDLTNSGSNQTSFSTDYKFNEKLIYDMRGNITQLWRNGFKLLGFTSNNYAAGDFAQIDALTYTYNAQNQVTRIVDAANIDKGFKYKSASTTAYQYDDNGNLTRDDNKGITLITYNYLNLPQEITFTGNRKLQFVYDAGGAKLRKIANNNGTETTTDYVNGTEYINTALQRIAHTEGSVTRQTDGSYRHEYVLRDHLGNTRVTFTDADNDGVVTASDIKQMNHYYPFGLNMEGNWNGASGENKYAYNGKEWNDDFGLGMNDYGARSYDAAIGRFTTADPMADFRSWVSPYQYVQNNPINRIDPTGMLDRKGADGMTNEQWMNASNPANNSIQAASTAYNGMAHAKTNYGNKKAENEYAAAHHGAKRAVEEDDIDTNASVEIRGTTVRDEQGNDYGGNCECGCDNKPPCNTLNPSTLGKNLFGMTYPGGNNPMKFNGLPDYSHSPGYRNLFEYPAIGHDRAYDLLGIKGPSGLVFDFSAIKADWRFVWEEFQISGRAAKQGLLFPYGNPWESTFKFLGLGIGLGLAATPKTIIFGLNPYLRPLISVLGNYSTSNTNNTPSK
jgi:RHS repeat-associated protein